MTRLRAAVLGRPISHSKSPALHRAAYEAAGQRGWRYDAIEMGSEELPGFVADLDDHWLGLSLTMPLKETGLAIADEVDEVARATGAVNTLVLPGSGRRGDGRTDGIAGYNTDVNGIVAAVQRAAATGRDTPAAVERVAILGAGATARSAAVAAARLGANSVEVYARRPEAADDVAAVAARFGCRTATAAWTATPAGLDADLVISTVPRGVADEWAADAANARGVLLDVVYDPWPTALAAAWQGSHTGGAVVPGLAMLLWQAVEQVHLMTGLHPDVAAMARAVGRAA